MIKAIVIAIPKLLLATLISAGVGLFSCFYMAESLGDLSLLVTLTLVLFINYALLKGLFPGRPIAGEMVIVTFLSIFLISGMLPIGFPGPDRDKARYTEGKTGLGAMQTKIKVAQQVNEHLPMPDTPPGVMSNLVRMVSDAESSPYFHATEFRPLTLGEAEALAQVYTNYLYKGRSQAQEEMDIGYDEYTGKYFKNENYQYRLIKQVDTTSNYAYAVTVVGDTNTRARVGGCYAVWVCNWESANAGNTKFIIATYGDEAADDSQTYRFLALDGETGDGRISLPPWNAAGDEIRSVRVGQHGGRWE